MSSIELTKLPVILPIINEWWSVRAGHRFCCSVLRRRLRTTGIVRCDQPRLVDLQARGAGLVKRLMDSALDEILARTVGIFQ